MKIFTALFSEELWERPLWAMGSFVLVVTALSPVFYKFQGPRALEQSGAAVAEGIERDQDNVSALVSLEYFREASQRAPALFSPKRHWMETYFHLTEFTAVPEQLHYEALNVANENATRFRQSALAVVQSFLVMAEQSSDPDQAQFALQWAENILHNRERLGLVLEARHHYLLGRVLLLKGDHELARLSLEKSVELQPRSLRNLFWLAMAYRKIGWSEPSLQLLRSLLEMKEPLEPERESKTFKIKAQECLTASPDCPVV